MSTLKVLTCLISMPANNVVAEIRKPESIHIETNYKELFAKAEITMPRNILLFEKLRLTPREVFKHGLKVNISFGYNGNLVPRFSGYITGVSADFPLKISLQDEMWKLSKLPVNYSAKSTALSNMLRSICPGYKVDALEGVDLGTVQFAKTTVGAVLQKIRSDFGLYSYMDGTTLICGKYYADNSADKIETINLDTYLAKNGLEYQNSDDIIALVKGNTTIKNKKVQYQVGDEGGDKYDFEYNLATSLDVLKIKVNADYAKIKRGGYKGSLGAFGEPIFKHGQKVKLVSYIYPDRQGNYFIDAVTTDYGKDGIVQELTLGGKA